MRRLLLFCLLLTSCTALMSQEPVSRTVTLTQSPALAYPRALRAMTQLGGEITHTDTQQGLISARVHNAVLMTVQVSPAAQGSAVAVVGTLMPNKVVVGSFHEVDTYITLLQQE